MKAAREHIDVNLGELDRALDGARHASKPPVQTKARAYRPGLFQPAGPVSELLFKASLRGNLSLPLLPNKANFLPPLTHRNARAARYRKRGGAQPAAASRSTHGAGETNAFAYL